MTNNKKIKYLVVIGVFLFIVITGFNMYYTRYIKDNLSTASARYEEPSASPRIIEKALVNFQNSTGITAPDITLWNRLEKESITNNITEKPVETNVIETYGDMSQVLPMNFVVGNYVYRDDDKGCVLDTKTAYDLFGTEQAINNIVEWKSKEYVVRGVVKAKDTMMLLEVPDEDHLYSNIEADFQKKVGSIVDNQGQLLSDLLVMNGLPEPKAVIDGDIMSWLLGISYRLPIWIIAIAVIVILIRYTIRFRNSSILLISYGAATILLSAIIIKLTNFNIHIPAEFIPTKWSDFNFYTDTYKTIQENIEQIHNCKQMPKEILRNSIQTRCMIYTALNIFLIILIKVQGFSKDNIQKKVAI